MADVKLKCAKCGKEVSVSEFAKIDNLRCMCGEALRRSDASQSEPVTGKHKRSTLTFKTDEQITQEHTAPKDPEEWRFTQQTKKDEKSQQQPRNTNLIVSWLLFIGLAGVMGYLRYAPNSLVPGVSLLLKQYGIVVFAALYLMIILTAFKDTIFQGLLCLIPLYPFYYIAMVCDDFLLRAAVWGLLVGIAQDSFRMINAEAMRLIDIVQIWIARGG